MHHHQLNLSGIGPLEDATLVGVINRITYSLSRSLRSQKVAASAVKRPVQEIENVALVLRTNPIVCRQHTRFGPSLLTEGTSCCVRTSTGGHCCGLRSRGTRTEPP
eukprot:6205837-Pleurochrysis_carterae.AAC.2